MSVIDNDMIEDVANMQINEEELPRIESMPNFEDEDQSTIVNNWFLCPILCGVLTLTKFIFHKKFSNFTYLLNSVQYFHV